MKAVQFALTIPGYLLVKSLGRWTDWPVVGGGSGLRVVDLPRPALPGPDWLGLDLVACGICGSDVSALWFSFSPSLEPFTSYPAVLGHEILARVAECGPDVEGFAVGQRVVVDPFIGCAIRGEPACPSCAQGWPGTCARKGETGAAQVDGEPMAPGMLIGNHRQLPGGWGEQLVAHRQHVFAVPDGVSDRAAVLTEPLSVAMHGVLQVAPEAGPVLVIGSGAIAMAVIWSLRATGFTGEIVSQAKRPHEAELATALGATRVVRPDEARDALLATGARPYAPTLGPEVYQGGGFPVVFDCVGNQGSLTQALAYTAPRGRVVLLGCAASFDRLDLTAVWEHEIQLVGFIGYGIEADGRHTFEHTLQALAADDAVARMVTHVYALDDVVDAVRAAANHRTSHAVKVVLTPDPDKFSA